MTQVRFYIDDVPTEWADEPVRHGQLAPHTAPTIATRLRAEHPTARLRVERRGDDRVPVVVKQYRFKIQVGDATYYSKVVQARDKESLRAEVREQFPKGVVTEEVI